MRIEFPHAAREDFHWSQAQLRIGSATENDLVLGGAQAAPRHLCIQHDRRGWVLQVLPDAGRIYVNARPVHERALLRPGDVVSVGDCRLLLCADDDPAQRHCAAVNDCAACTVALRAVAGPLSGKVLPLHGQLELGPHGQFPLELPQGETVSLRLAWRDGRLLLQLLEPSATHPLRVNGVRVGTVAVQPGDQIGVGMHRFVVEAPGMKPEPEIIAKAPVPSGADAGVPRSSGGAWWLILTAALLAVGIGLVLLIRF